MSGNLFPISTTEYLQYSWVVFNILIMIALLLREKYEFFFIAYVCLAILSAMILIISNSFNFEAFIYLYFALLSIPFMPALYIIAGQCGDIDDNVFKFK